MAIAVDAMSGTTHGAGAVWLQGCHWDGRYTAKEGFANVTGVGD